ncbi:hypothetical protein JCM19241_5969 [Vibrio ishigakensis]|uniref:DUF6950 domain-containing protein n=1 Tax=Vibrio ishigakensis TaxID=1481914 RepID=A0A0B8QQ25_9VIBR|nr:hypothetical protein JCM19241_5969 [Vibrio ishigakensis]
MQGQQLSYGSTDCNLIWCKLYEPDLYDLFKGRYSTLAGGLRVLKRELDKTSITNLLESLPNYREVSFSMARTGDILVKGNDTCFVMGDKVAGYHNDIFTVRRLPLFKGMRVFRKTELATMSQIGG